MALAVCAAVSAASAGYVVGTAVERSREPVPASAPPPRAPAIPDPVEVREGVPGSALQPAMSADLYVDRMRILRDACISAGNGFGISAVEEGVFGECWNRRRDERAWAEWISVRVPR